MCSSVLSHCILLGMASQKMSAIYAIKFLFCIQPVIILYICLQLYVPTSAIRSLSGIVISVLAFHYSSLARDILITQLQKCLLGSGARERKAACHDMLNTLPCHVPTDQGKCGNRSYIISCLDSMTEVRFLFSLCTQFHMFCHLGDETGQPHEFYQQQSSLSSSFPPMLFFLV